LFGNLRQLTIEQTFRTQTYGIVQEQITKIPGAYLEEVRYDTTTPNNEIVRAVVRSHYEFTPAQVSAIAAKLPAAPNGRVIDFRLRFIATTVITGDGYLYNDSGGLIK